MFLLWIIEENAHGNCVFARFYRPGGGGGFELFLPGGFARGDGQAWN